MRIYYPIDDFLFELFANPEDGKNDADKLIQQLKAYYSNMGVSAEVTIEDKLAVVDISVKQNKDGESAFKKAVELCNKHEFAAAKEALAHFIKDNPAHSEAHRLLGQIYSEEGDNEKAQDQLIEALRMNPKNDSALIMMGNILSNFHRDAKSAQKYFEQANAVKPNNYVILNNLGGNSLKLNRLSDAKKYFTEALQANQTYANTHYGLAIIAEKENDLHSVFYSAINAIKYAGENRPLREQAMKLCFEVCVPIIRNSASASDAVNDYAKNLQTEFQVVIEFVDDEAIQLPAYLELAENHGRSKHIIRYKSSIPTYDYWKLHALVMLRLILAARVANVNERFATNNETKKTFLTSVEENVRYLASQGMKAEMIERIMDEAFVGVTQLLYNTPIDLFVEDTIYQEFAEFRPHQFVSLHSALKSNLESVTNENVVRNSPKNVLSVTKAYGLLKALHFRDLYGIDLVADFQPSDKEKRQAQELFNEFTEYRGDMQPGDEYKVLKNWANVLGVDGFFELIPDMHLVASDGHDSPDRADEEMEKFQKKAAALGLNMAVVMYMVDALDFFAKKDNASIKKAAMEIAMLGMQGIKPEQQGYNLTNVPGKSFSGYHLLAYYYVSFALVLPEMLNELKLPYDQEYGLALQMQKR